MSIVKDFETWGCVGFCYFSFPYTKFDNFFGICLLNLPYLILISFLMGDRNKKLSLTNSKKIIVVGGGGSGEDHYKK